MNSVRARTSCGEEPRPPTAPATPGRTLVQKTGRVLCAAAVCAIGLDFLGVVPATALPTSAGNDPTETSIEAALDAVGADPAIPSSSDPDSASVSTAGGITVDVPVHSSQPVIVQGAGTPQVQITPPSGHGPGQRATGGFVIAAEGDGGVAVQPVPGGVRLMTILDRPSSEHRIRFHVQIEGGGTIEQAPNGLVGLKAADGGTFGTFDVPWAIDAAGTAIPTHYEVVDMDLIQIVEPSGPVTYPIVADPDYRTNCGIVTCKRYYSHVRSVQLYNEYQGKITAGYSQSAAFCALGAFGGIPGGVFSLMCYLGWAWLSNQFVDAITDAAHGDGCAALEYLRASPLGAKDPTDWDYVRLSNSYCEKS